MSSSHKKLKPVSQSSLRLNLPRLPAGRFIPSLLRPLLVFFLLVVLVVNVILYSRFLSDPVFTARLNMLSLSLGDKYYGRLQLWQYYAQNADWESAAKLEPGLDPADIARYKYNHHPDSIKKQLNQLMVKPDKSVDDWIQLARFFLAIGKINEAKDAVAKARALDPIRADVERISRDLQSIP